jgi:uncharacterized protein HemY
MHIKARLHSLLPSWKLSRKNANRQEIEKLIIDSYISSKNYKEALILLEKISRQKIN